MSNLKNKFIQLSFLGKMIVLFVSLLIIALVATLILFLIIPQTNNTTNMNNTNSTTKSLNKQSNGDTVKDTRPHIIGLENITYRGVSTRAIDNLKSALISYFDNTDNNQHSAKKVEISNDIKYSKTINGTQEYVSVITIDDETQKRIIIVVSNRGDGSLLSVTIADTDGNNAEVIYGSILNNQ